MKRFLFGLSIGGTVSILVVFLLSVLKPTEMDLKTRNIIKFLKSSTDNTYVNGDNIWKLESSGGNYFLSFVIKDKIKLVSENWGCGCFIGPNVSDGDASNLRKAFVIVDRGFVETEINEKLIGIFQKTISQFNTELKNQKQEQLSKIGDLE